jgi:hypothetical protein
MVDLTALVDCSHLVRSRVSSVAPFQNLALSLFRHGSAVAQLKKFPKTHPFRQKDHKMSRGDSQLRSMSKCAAFYCNYGLLIAGLEGRQEFKDLHDHECHVGRSKHAWRCERISLLGIML